MQKGKLLAAIAAGGITLAGVAIEFGKADPLGMFRPMLGERGSPFDSLFPGRGRLGPIPENLDVSRLKAGLEALQKGDYGAARAARDGLPRDHPDWRILTFAIASAGRDVTSQEIDEAAALLADWPGIESLRRSSERALYREKPEPEVVIERLGRKRPLTMEGVRALARAYLAVDDADSARAVLSRFWRTENLDAASEAAFIRDFGALISPADYRFRMEKMLYAEQPNSARRLAEPAQARELAEAWAAVLRKDRRAGKLLEAVPEAQRSAGWTYAKAKYLRRTGKITQAAAIMLSAPTDRQALVDPDEWWIERRVLARELLDQGDVRTAYRIVAAHAAEKPANIADAEFHAGWFALRGLNDPNAAAPHFARILDVAEGPISRSRAYYWLGRAAEAGGPGEAEEYYRKAAAFGTAFYGQLAAARLGQTTIPVHAPEPTQADRERFAARDSVKAIRRLEAAGFPARAESLCRDLARQLESPGELALLAALAEERGNHHLGLKIAKIAASRGIDIGALTHPIGAIPTEAEISQSGQALAYAVARQESEFNPAAVSRAGALGLLQLLPSTAREVASKSGVPFSPERLTSDAAYNATLGAAFLDEQLARFDGSYVLTFAAYNAGPRRAREWIARYGDPRGKELNAVIDWIERIPFSETRSYVQRVMENYVVYKMRLTGRFDIAQDLVSGRIMSQR